MRPHEQYVSCSDRENFHESGGNEFIQGGYFMRYSTEHGHRRIGRAMQEVKDQRSSLSPVLDTMKQMQLLVKPKDSPAHPYTCYILLGPREQDLSGKSVGFGV